MRVARACEWGAEAQFYRNGEFLTGHRLDTCEQPIAWAEDMREVYEKGWEEV